MNDGCPGCGACLSACPVKAIEIERTKAVIDMEKCIQCDVCTSSCPVKLIEKKEADGNE